MQALGKAGEAADEWEIIHTLHETSKVAIPPAIEEIRDAKIRHDFECDVADMKAMILEIISHF